MPRIEFSDYLLVRNPLPSLYHIKLDKSYFSRELNNIFKKEIHPQNLFNNVSVLMTSNAFERLQKIDNVTCLVVEL